jgi:hypothetical protein
LQPFFVDYKAGFGVRSIQQSYELAVTYQSLAISRGLAFNRSLGTKLD